MPYTLFSCGKDGQEYTGDDIWPNAPAAVATQ